jgi:hypothetical protein
VAGPSVVVRVLGDISGLGKAFAAAGGTAQSAAGKAAGAFHNMLGGLNQTGVLGPFAGALAGIDAALDTVGNKGKNLPAIFAGAGAAVTGAGALLASMGSKDQAAHQQLQAAIEATGATYEEYGGQIEKAIGHQERYGNTAHETMNALEALTQATGDPGKALALLGTASDVAKAKHESLGEAATQLGKVYNGSARLLKEFGLQQDTVKDSSGHLSQAVDDLGKKVAGQADAATNTFSGHLSALKAHIEDSAAALGQKYGPALQTVGLTMIVLPTIIQGVAAAFTGLGVAMDLALSPMVVTIGVIGLAIVALIAIAYVLYRNWDSVWGAMKTAVNFVWQILQDVWHWISDNWPLLLAILGGPFGLAVKFIVDHWSGIVDFFSGLISDIVNVFKDVGKAIASPFVWAWNLIARAWNDTVGKLSFHIPSWVPLLGGKGFEMPRLPTVALAAGGIVTAPTLALLGEAGPEAVVPLGTGVGPAVNIENAVFTGGADLDLLMAKVAFATTAGRL